MAERKLLRVVDVVLVIVVVAVGVGWYLFDYVFSNKKATSYQLQSGAVSVRIQGEEVLRVIEPGDWIIKNKDGKYVTTLHFDGQKVWVTESNCPDKICEKTGKVGPGGSIICVPNRMIIEFKKEKHKNAVDTETW